MGELVPFAGGHVIQTERHNSGRSRNKRNKKRTGNMESEIQSVGGA